MRHHLRPAQGRGPSQTTSAPLPQFALGKSLTDLTSFGAAGLDGTFTPGPWSSVKTAGGLFGLPMDSGPMALFFAATRWQAWRRRMAGLPVESRLEW